MAYTPLREFFLKQILKYMFAYIITHVRVYKPLRGMKKNHCLQRKYNRMNTKSHCLQCFMCEGEKKYCSNDKIRCRQ
jgi:hypothetical protein